ncbi:hypothetical protein VTK73DRAFT_9700 [Phialemonium thermophilum]|uniref:18S rRNA factor 2 n=1 Tax=Phialemonium thermophilum TaxID=223376 RepID=A0ABR3W0U3_9PEZI
MFVDGWVEFVDKRRAKDAVALLNARPIGGKKGTYYRDDLWSLVYLRGFKWHNLTEQIAAENAERESRMRAEIAKSTRENKEFVRNVERARMLDGMQAKAEAKKRRLSGAEGGGMEKTADEVAAGSKRGAATALDAEVPLSAPDKKAKREKKMTFSQIPLAKKRDLEEEQPEHVKRVLSKIF